ncbi:hypothetical protein [Mesorhizobium sp. INR15]|uniref:hypothetical protein n=1 Tax=Mesorhizobium sp. INR15 TaxID=2654248 RepID=UPI0018966DEB|nr:hypothetical protein [Mesorhizobium sp. INR15]QPC94892.1 hypothetical protein GA829_32305 [Mesorhizobium sp. INR15]
MNKIKFCIAFAGLALFLAQPSSIAYGAGQCSEKSYREARSAMTSRLLATGYSKAQVGFLMRNADRMTSALRGDKLNDSGQRCGIDSARAHVLGCLDKQLFPLRSGSSASLNEEKQTRGFWGRKRLSVRELLFIGQFHGCLGAAKEYLFRG